MVNVAVPGGEAAEALGKTPFDKAALKVKVEETGEECVFELEQHASNVWVSGFRTLNYSKPGWKGVGVGTNSSRQSYKFGSLYLHIKNTDAYFGSDWHFGYFSLEMSVFLSVSVAEDEGISGDFGSVQINRASIVLNKLKKGICRGRMAYSSPLLRLPTLEFTLTFPALVPQA